MMNDLDMKIIEQKGKAFKKKKKDHIIPYFSLKSKIYLFVNK